MQSGVPAEARNRPFWEPQHAGPASKGAKLPTFLGWFGGQPGPLKSPNSINSGSGWDAGCISSTPLCWLRQLDMVIGQVISIVCRVADIVSRVLRVNISRGAKRPDLQLLITRLTMPTTRFTMLITRHINMLSSRRQQKRCDTSSPSGSLVCRAARFVTCSMCQDKISKSYEYEHGPRSVQS